MVSRRGRTEVAANWKNGNSPEDQMSRSLRSPSGYESQLSLRARGSTSAYPDDAEDVRVDIECALMNSGR